MMLFRIIMRYSADIAAYCKESDTAYCACLFGNSKMILSFAESTEI